MGGNEHLVGERQAPDRAADGHHDLIPAGLCELARVILEHQHDHALGGDRHRPGHRHGEVDRRAGHERGARGRRHFGQVNRVALAGPGIEDPLLIRLRRLCRKTEAGCENECRRTDLAGH